MKTLDQVEKVKVREKELNAITIITMTPEEVIRQVYPLIAVPIISPNTPVDVESTIAPLLSIISNEAAFLAHMYSIAVSLKSTLKKEKGKVREDVDMLAAQAKIDILYRAHQATSDQYSALSRVLKIIEERPHSVLKAAHSG
jgi:hypothetical protein